MNRPTDQETPGDRPRSAQLVAASKQDEIKGATLAIRADQSFWTRRQLAALRSLGVAETVEPADLAVFMHQCFRTRLDPFSRQIYLIGRKVWNPNLGDNGGYELKQTIQTGIDGFRVIRDRAADRRGETVEYEDTIWYDADGGEHAVWLDEKPPAACKVVVLVWAQGATRARRFPAVLRTASYIATNKQGNPQANWKTQADHMIEKCCEAFGLRRAYPHDLGGLYIDEEMQGPDGSGGAPARVRAKRDDGGVWQPEPDPDPRPPAAEPNGDGDTDQSPEAVRRRALGRVHAIFNEHGLGGAENSATRHDVLGAVLQLREGGREDGRLLPVESTGGLSTELLDRAGSLLSQLAREATAKGQDVRAGLTGMGEAFRKAADSQARAARRKGPAAAEPKDGAS
jgi:phage recombination protein Bet